MPTETAPLTADVEASARRYFEAWRRRFPGDVTRELASYRDPFTGGVLSGADFEEHLEFWRVALEPVGWEIVDVAVGARATHVSWTVRVRHSGNLLGSAASGSDFQLSGTDTVRESGDGLHVHRLFDLGELAEATGTEMTLRPRSSGELQHGTATRQAGLARGEVGALALTWLGVRDTEESDKVDQLSVEVYRALRLSKGFLGSMTMDVGDRKYTLSAFDSPESIRAVQNKAHRRAVRKFFSGGLCTEAVISTWVPDSTARFLRCRACGAITSPARTTCECAQTPEPPTLL